MKIDKETYSLLCGVLGGLQEDIDAYCVIKSVNDGKVDADDVVLDFKHHRNKLIKLLTGKIEFIEDEP